MPSAPVAGSVMSMPRVVHATRRASIASCSNLFEVNSRITEVGFDYLPRINRTSGDDANSAARSTINSSNPCASVENAAFETVEGLEASTVGTVESVESGESGESSFNYFFGLFGCEDETISNTNTSAANAADEMMGSLVYGYYSDSDDNVEGMIVAFGA